MSKAFLIVGVVGILLGLLLIYVAGGYRHAWGTTMWVPRDWWLQLPFVLAGVLSFLAGVVFIILGALLKTEETPED